jgi:hypothetical protein
MLAIGLLTLSAGGTMKVFKFIMPALILAGGLTITASVSFATKEYTAKEKKGCAFCHTKAGAKELNAVGECYKKGNHSLAGCEAK